MNGRAAARERSRGFTLLEVMIALAILAPALMVVSDIIGNALRNHAYARELDAATLLARGKMAELEEQYEDSGFKDFDETAEGDFSAEGHGEVRWRLELKRPDAQLSPEQLIGFLAGAGGGDTQDVLAKLMGLGAGGGSGAGGTGPAPIQGAAGAAMSGLFRTQLTQFGERIKKSLREVRLTVGWRDGKAQRQLQVVTHLVVLNPRAPGGARGESPDAPPGLQLPTGGLPLRAPAPAAAPGQGGKG